MIDINADIISYKSLGNIEIGRDVEFYADELYENFDVEESTWEKPSSSNKVGYELKYLYCLNNGTITISTNWNGRIEELWCNQNYKGKYTNKYKNELYAGITMGELLNLTKKQLIFWGELILDDDYGMAITLPSPWDELDDYFKDIPSDLTLNEIYVGNRDCYRTVYKKREEKNQSGKQDELDNKADIISPKFIRNIDV